MPRVQKKPNRVALIAAPVALLLAFVLWRHLSNPADKLHPSAAAGEVLAEEVARAIGGSGKVAVISRQPLERGVEASREILAAFEAGLKRHSKVTLAAADWLPRPRTGTMDLGIVTPEQFLAALQKHPEANALVILAGMTPYSAELADQLKTRSLKVLAVCGYTADVKRWLESKAMAGAIVPRPGELPPGSPVPKTRQEWFQREFLLLTPETLQNAPY